MIACAFSNLVSGVFNVVTAARLDLSNNLLQSTIPTHIGSLTSLELLDLGSNKLAGRIPTELGRLRQLGKYWIQYFQ
jgi:Leucine-rich repeat (LRR) protein